ncbi:hypothetical protein V1477_015905 [Vespula maculifrons]|uniref:Uncharacterized protein n=1 Tax=Vespula maculifrons TaxID=7453 RepID=A0ABD2BBM6_VESMC
MSYERPLYDVPYAAQLRSFRLSSCKIHRYLLSPGTRVALAAPSMIMMMTMTMMMTMMMMITTTTTITTTITTTTQQQQQTCILFRVSIFSVGLLGKGERGGHLEIARATRFPTRSRVQESRPKRQTEKNDEYEGEKDERVRIAVKTYRFYDLEYKPMPIDSSLCALACQSKKAQFSSMGNSQRIMSTDPGQPFITDLHRDKKRILHNALLLPTSRPINADFEKRRFRVEIEISRDIGRSRLHTIIFGINIQSRKLEAFQSTLHEKRFAGTGWSVVAIKDPNENE